MLDWLAPRPGMRLVDVAGGTGDIAFRYLSRVKGDGRHRARRRTCSPRAAAAPRRRPSPTGSTGWSATRWRCRSPTRASTPTIAFGIRNVTRPRTRSPRRSGCCGRAAGSWCSSSARSRAVLALALRPLLVQRHPGALGQALAGDRDSYRYLVESIRRFPDQEAFAAMIAAAGFGQVRYRNLSMGIAAALGLEALRGPHNLWRLIRTGATFERTGAMKPRWPRWTRRRLRVAARVLGWPFQWLGLEGDPSQPPILRALTALGPAYIKFGQLLSAPTSSAPSSRPSSACCRTSCRPSRWTRRAPRSRPSSVSRSRRSSRASRSGRRRLARAGAPRDAARDRAGGRGQGAAAGDRARLPARRRSLLPRASSSCWRLRPAAAARSAVINHFEKGGAERARPADGGLGRGRVRGQHRARPRLPGAGGGRPPAGGC